MKMTTVYISGKVTGLPIEQVTQKFERVANELFEKGYHVVNPIQAIAQYNANHWPFERLKDWREEMQFVIGCLMDCDELYLLPCWNDSKGARLERDIAVRLGMPITYL